MSAVGLLIVLTGCTTDPQDNVPVVNASVPRTDRANILEQERTVANTVDNVETSTEDVVNVIPQGQAEDIQTFPVGANDSQSITATTTAVHPQAQAALPSVDSFTSGKPLDGAVAALLATAQQQQEANKLDAAAASIERAQRIAPSEPRVLYSLATVRLKQGDAAEAEQLAKRALSYTSADQTDLKSSLWEIVASSLDMQGDQAAADQARQQK